jgi:hypothetical protein
MEGAFQLLKFIGDEKSLVKFYLIKLLNGCRESSWDL